MVRCATFEGTRWRNLSFEAKLSANDLYELSSTLDVAVLAGPFLAFTVKHSQPDLINNVYGWPRSILYVFSVLFENPSCDTDTLPQTPAPKLFLTTWWILWLV